MSEPPGAAKASGLGEASDTDASCMLARHLDAGTVVVYTTVAYATIKNECSLPICSGHNSDLSALSADARGAGPSDGVVDIAHNDSDVIQSK